MKYSLIIFENKYIFIKFIIFSFFILEIKKGKNILFKPFFSQKFNKLSTFLISVLKETISFDKTSKKILKLSIDKLSFSFVIKVYFIFFCRFALYKIILLSVISCLQFFWKLCIKKFRFFFLRY